MQSETVVTPLAFRVNFQRIDSIDRIAFLGEHIFVVGDAAAAPWQWIATASSIPSVLFIADASRSLWLKGAADARRKASVVGGAITFFFMIAILNTQLIIWAVLTAPTMIAPSFLNTLGAMAFEMSLDTLRTSRLARELHESERALAANTAGLALWSWDAHKSRIWATDRGGNRLCKTCLKSGNHVHAIGMLATRR